MLLTIRRSIPRRHVVVAAGGHSRTDHGTLVVDHPDSRHHCRDAVGRRRHCHDAVGRSHHHSRLGEDGQTCWVDFLCDAGSALMVRSDQAPEDGIFSMKQDSRLIRTYLTVIP